MFSAAGIIIPVIIHLWNRKQGKTLKVGSISLLTESYKQQAKNIQLKERLLLLLRSLIVLLLAFLISHPVWNKQRNIEGQKGWILIEKNALKETYARFHPLIDSLIFQKYEFHFFYDGFQKSELSEALKEKTDSLSVNNISYWRLLSSLNQQVPASLPVYLFTTNSITRFTGKRPELAMNLQWYLYTPKDSVSQWLAKAYMMGKDSVRLVSATSGPFGRSFAFKSAPFNEIILSQNPGLPVSYPAHKQVTVDTGTLKLTIFTDKYFTDASYVKAALEAIRQYTKRK
ncbi:MAG: BatA domain-containing protein, partial [Chitinophagaceae bacterium]